MAFETLALAFPNKKLARSVEEVEISGISAIARDAYNATAGDIVEKVYGPLEKRTLNHMQAVSRALLSDNPFENPVLSHFGPPDLRGEGHDPFFLGYRLSEIRMELEKLPFSDGELQLTSEINPDNLEDSLNSTIVATTRSIHSVPRKLHRAHPLIIGGIMHMDRTINTIAKNSILQIQGRIPAIAINPTSLTFALGALKSISGERALTIMTKDFVQALFRLRQDIKQVVMTSNQDIQDSMFTPEEFNYHINWPHSYQV